LRVLLLSQRGSGLGLASRIAAEQHDVDVYIRDSIAATSGDGIVNRPVSWRQVLGKADLVVADSGGFGKYADYIRESGKPFLCGDAVFDELSEDPEKGKALMRRLAIAYPTKEDVARSKELLKSGVLITLEGWWNGMGWMRPWVYIFNEKSLFPRQRGPIVESMGSTVYAQHKPSKLAENTLERAKPFIKRTGYRGPVSMDLLVTKDNVLSMAFRGGFTYDAIEALVEGMSDNVTETLFKTATGTTDGFDTKPFTMSAVRLTIPPWPYTVDSGAWTIDPSIKGVNKFNLKHLFLGDIRRYEDGQLELSGGRGVVLKATATGVDHFESRRRACRTLDNIEIANKQYRYDIGMHVDKYLDNLKTWGWMS